MPDPHIQRMKPWIDSFADDVAILEHVVDAAAVPRAARLICASALGYLVTRLDLIPDWEETAGILDDAMVLRTAMALASENDLDPLEDDAQRVIHRLANENEVVRDFLGDDLYGKFKKYVDELGNVVVRGRHPRVVLEDEKERKQFFIEVKDQLKNFPPAPMKDPEAVARTIKNYLSHKLK